MNAHEAHDTWRVYIILVMLIVSIGILHGKKKNKIKDFCDSTKVKRHIV